MAIVNMPEAKTSRSRLVEAVESGAEKEIAIARNGKPAARLAPVAKPVDESERLGMLEGKCPPMPLEDINGADAEIAAMFFGEDP